MSAFNKSSFRKTGEDGYGIYYAVDLTLNNVTKAMSVSYYEPSAHSNLQDSYHVEGVFIYGRKGFRRPEYVVIVKTDEGKEFAYMPNKYCKRASIKNLEFIDKDY